MNTLTSVVLLSLLVAISQAGIINLNVSWGMNLTLVGPSDLPVTWYDGKGMQFCDGNTIKNPQIKHSCDQQNLTLLNADKSHERTYLGYRHDSKGKVDYKVTVIPPPPATVKPQPGPEYVYVNMGENKTLVGPPGIPVTWFNQDGLQFCNGNEVLHPEFNHTCDMQNLTLLFINLTHDGAYLGYNHKGTKRTWYEVVVSDGFPKSGEMKVEEQSRETEQKQAGETEQKQTGQKQSVQKQGGQKETSQKKTSDKQKPSHRRPSKLKPNTPDTKLITVTSGSNVTLVGPAGKVTWYDDDLKRPCEPGYKLVCKCDNQNLTLINVTKLYEGVYYGTNDKSDSKRYRVKVNTTNSQSVKIQPYTRPTTPEKNHKFELQIDSNQDNDKIPSTTVAIVVGVIAGFITLIIVILCYICCRKRPRAYNNMVDPLLSFSY